MGYLMEQPKLLIFDEDTTNQKILAFCFRNDFNITSCSTEKEIQSKMKENKFDVMLITASVKSDDKGLQIVKDLRRVDGYETTPIIFVTPNGFKKDEKLAKDYGVTKYFKKPIENKVLIKEFKECLSSTANR